MSLQSMYKTRPSIILLLVGSTHAQICLKNMQNNLLLTNFGVVGYYKTLRDHTVLWLPAIFFDLYPNEGMKEIHLDITITILSIGISMVSHHRPYKHHLFILIHVPRSSDGAQHALDAIAIYSRQLTGTFQFCIFCPWGSASHAERRLHPSYSR